MFSNIANSIQTNNKPANRRRTSMETRGKSSPTKSIAQEGAELEPQASPVPDEEEIMPLVDTVVMLGKEANIMPLPQARSEVWNYFGFMADENNHITDKSKVICRICGLNFCYSGNTTNFYSHLRSMHSDISLKRTNNSLPRTPASKAGSKRAASESEETFEQFQEPSTSQAVPTASSVVPEVSKQNNNSAIENEYFINSDKITSTLVNFVVHDCRPVDVLYGQGFQALLNLLAPGYLLPKKATLLMDLRRRYDQLQKEKNIPDIAKSLGS